MTTTRFVEIHALQTMPYSNLNRDDLGSPKDVVYGGVTRTRVSSQCWKRAVRLALQDHLGDQAVRTRRIVNAVKDNLVADGWPSELAEEAGKQIVYSAGAEKLTVEKENRTSVALFLPQSSIIGLAKLAEQYRPEIETAAAKATERSEKKPAKKAGKAAKEEKPDGVLPTAEIDELLIAQNDIISLFGRMLAEMPSAKVDGAVQVAHSFTTHAVDTQIDFFTAVDDVEDVKSGSAHMSFAEFSAGVFYRYACVDLADLVRNLNGNFARAIELTGLFAELFLTAMPQAKKTSTAPHTIPDLAYITVRQDRPVSLAAAFENPIKTIDDFEEQNKKNQGGYAEQSRIRLAEHSKNVQRLLGNRGLVHSGHSNVDGLSLDGLGEQYESFADLIDAAMRAAGNGQQ